MRLAPAVLTAALLLGIAAPTAATVVVLPTLEEMTHRSDVVIHGIVRTQDVIEERPGRIVTITTIEVLDAIAGAKVGDLVTIHQLGGSLGGTEAWIAGAHRFALNEEVVFFGNVIPKRPGVIVPYGIGFGIFDVVDDVDGRHVVEAKSDVAQLVVKPDGSQEMQPVTPRHYDSLEAFTLQLRAIRDGRNPAPLQKKRIISPNRPLRR